MFSFLKRFFGRIFGFGDAQAESVETKSTVDEAPVVNSDEPSVYGDDAPEAAGKRRGSSTYNRGSSYDTTKDSLDKSDSRRSRQCDHDGFVPGMITGVLVDEAVNHDTSGYDAPSLDTFGGGSSGSAGASDAFDDLSSDTRSSATAAAVASTAIPAATYGESNGGSSSNSSHGSSYDNGSYDGGSSYSSHSSNSSHSSSSYDSSSSSSSSSSSCGSSCSSSSGSSCGSSCGGGCGA